jgi:glucosylceramidase
MTVSPEPDGGSRPAPVPSPSPAHGSLGSAMGGACPFLSFMKTFSLMFATFALGAATAAAESRTASVYVTARESSSRLAAGDQLEFSPMPQPEEVQQCVFVDPTHAFETVVGIGGAITDAAAETFAKLPPARQKELIRAYYDPVAGIGYSIARTQINSCDFSSHSYSYVVDGDRELRTFDIAPDLQFRVPMIKAAIAAAGGSLTLYASPWSPPAWMKDNGDMLHGGKLRPEFRDAWARYFVKFIQAYEAQGVPIWGVTVQNEPMAVQTWESCIFTAEEERDFVRDHLGPTLAANGLGDRKIIGWDHNRGQFYQRASTLLNDPAAARYFWGFGFHWYIEDVFENVQRVHEAFPDKRLIFSEGCNGPYNAAQINNWNLAENYGRSMINDFNHGAAGWTDWNILLDEHGGPNHVGNFCFAPVHGDTRTGELHFTPAYYYIGHFSKFVRPGARRIIASPTVGRLMTTAFLNPDGSIAVIVMNQSEEAQPFYVWVNGMAAPTNSPAHSMMTVLIPR